MYILTGFTPMASGIYGIKNKVTGKHYIGSTKNFSKRWGEHKYHLKRGTHHSIKLQRSYDKHGVSSFEFFILQEVEDCSQLREVEESFIKLYQSWINGYNVLKRGAKLGDYEEGTVRNVSKGEYTTRKKIVEAADVQSRKLTIRCSDEEYKILVNYCIKREQTQNDVLREHIRSLPKKKPS